MPVESPPRITADTVLGWIRESVAIHSARRLEIVAHGGTALSLRGLKESTRDVDFSVSSRAEFDALRGILEDIGYVVGMDFASYRSRLIRLVKSGANVSPVDLHHPEWNNWRATATMQAAWAWRRFGQVRLGVPDRDTLFLFKTYPLLESDLSDLAEIVRRDPPDLKRVRDLCAEQDELLRRELFREDVAYEPLFLLLELRTRLHASLSLLPAPARREIFPLARYGRKQFAELGLKIPVLRLARRIRIGPGINWDRILGRLMEPLRARLAP